jgi:hypothetical protein
MPEMPPEIRLLFEDLRAMATAGRLRPVPADHVIVGTSFFPGGWGLWDAPRNRRFPVGGTLILGNTWGTRPYLEAVVREGAEVQISRSGAKAKDPTWRNLLAILNRAGLDPSTCFFTNAFPGLVEGNIVGSVGVRRSSEAWAWCQRFFTRTLDLLRPKGVLALGLDPIRFSAVNGRACSASATSTRRSSLTLAASPPWP